jgi:D-alanyl-D-alanine carboxypeptidase
MKTLLYLVVLIITAILKSFGQLPPSQIQDNIQLYLDEYKQSLLVQNNIDVPGWIVRVEKVGQWQQTWVNGVADNTTTTPLNGLEKFRIGNTTQIFIAVAILKLIQNNQIILSDTITNWLPVTITSLIPNASTITIKQLLQHTSGIAGYNDPIIGSGELIAAPIIQDWYNSTYINNYSFDTIMNTYFTAYTPIALPSSNIFNYSETNYLLLGKIIETSSGMSWQQYIQQAIILPLNLTNTSCIIDNDLTIPSNFMNGYILSSDDFGNLESMDATIQNNSIYKASRGIISNLNDLNTFWKSVRQGEIIPQNLSNLMQTCNAYPFGDTTSFGFGLGCVEPNQGYNWIGNEGNIEGHASATYYLPSIDAYVSVVNNLMQSNAGIVASVEFVVSQYSLSNTQFSNDTFSIFPNPTTNFITLNSNEQVAETIEIYDLQGRKVVSIVNAIKNPTIDVSYLSTGDYILKMKSNNQFIVKKLIKK